MFYLSFLMMILKVLGFVLLNLFCPFELQKLNLYPYNIKHWFTSFNAFIFEKGNIRLGLPNPVTPKLFPTPNTLDDLLRMFDVFFWLTVTGLVETEIRTCLESSRGEECRAAGCGEGQKRPGSKNPVKKGKIISRLWRTKPLTVPGLRATFRLDLLEVVSFSTC